MDLEYNSYLSELVIGVCVKVEYILVLCVLSMYIWLKPEENDALF